MKLSKSQNEVLTKCKTKIDIARTSNINDFMNKIAPNTDLSEENFKQWNETYENYKLGVAHIHANSKILLKLEELGLIEIVELTTGHAYGIDKIKILNY